MSHTIAECFRSSSRSPVLQYVSSLVIQSRLTVPGTATLRTGVAAIRGLVRKLPVYADVHLGEADVVEESVPDKKPR